MGPPGFPLPCALNCKSARGGCNCTCLPPTSRVWQPDSATLSERRASASLRPGQIPYLAAAIKADRPGAAHLAHGKAPSGVVKAEVTAQSTNWSLSKWWALIRFLDSGREVLCAFRFSKSTSRVVSRTPRTRTRTTGLPHGAVAAIAIEIPPPPPHRVQTT